MNSASPTRVAGIEPTSPPGSGVQAADPLATGVGQRAATVDEVAASFRERGLSPRLRLTPLARPGIEAELGDLGWETCSPTLVMTVSLPLAARPPLGESEIAVSHGPIPSDAWRAAHLAGHLPAEADERLALALRARGARTYAQASRPCSVGREPRQGRGTSSADAAAAIGLAVAGDGLVGVYDVLTVPGQRRAGLGRRVVLALLDWGAERGARLAYLQVAEDNAPATTLYRSLGFTTLYRYHYAEPGPA